MNKTEKSHNRTQQLLQSALENMASIVRFYSRLPFPPLPWEKTPYEMPSFGKIILWLPAAAFTIAIPGMLILGLSLWFGLAPWIAATLGLGVTTLMTGAFHEDGLGDVADGFGGGYTIERRLVIMSDSRLGTFGVCALVLCFALKIGGLAVIAERTSLFGACMALAITAIVARVCSLAVIVFIPPVRLPEATYTAETFSRKLFAYCMLSATALTFLFGGAFFSLSGLLFIPILSLIVSYAFGLLSLRLIHGQTGDVAGAAEQLSEIVCLLILSVSF